MDRASGQGRLFFGIHVRQADIGPGWVRRLVPKLFPGLFPGLVGGPDEGAGGANVGGGHPEHGLCLALAFRGFGPNKRIEFNIHHLPIQRALDGDGFFFGLAVGLRRLAVPFAKFGQEFQIGNLGIGMLRADPKSPVALVRAKEVNSVFAVVMDEKPGLAIGIGGGFQLSGGINDPGLGRGDSALFSGAVPASPM